MNQVDMFNGPLSEKLKREGMERAEDNAKSALELARELAVSLGIRNRFVNADDVGRLLKKAHGIDTLGPAAGSLFKGSLWVFSGSFVKSKRVTNHSRLLRVWEYVGRPQ